MKVLLMSVFLVMASCSSTSTQESTSEYVDNAAISTKIKSKLIAKDGINASNIEVESYKGTVILSGFVSSEDQKDRALDIAKRTSGVVEVKDAIYLREDIEGKMSE